MFPGETLGTLAEFREAPPDGRSDQLPGPRVPVPPPGDPLSLTPSGFPQHTPLRRPSLVRPPPAPRPAPGEPRAPTPPPARSAREPDGGGDGDWAAARGRVLGGEAWRPLSFSAPAPLSPPSVLARRRPRSALSPRLLLLPHPWTLSPPLPHPLLSSPPPLSPPSAFPELPAGPERWLRGGVTESPGLGKAAGSETPSRGRVSRSRWTPCALREGEAAPRARWGWRGTPARVLAEPSRPAETWLRARELRSGAHGARGEGRGLGRGAAAGRVLDAGNARERLLLFSLPRPPAAEVEKSCVWNSDLPGSRRESCSPAAAGELRPGVTAATAALGSWAQLRAPGTAPEGPPVVAPAGPGLWRVGHAGHRRQLLLRFGLHFCGQRSDLGCGLEEVGVEWGRPHLGWVD